MKEDPSSEAAILPPGIAIIGMAGRFPGAQDVAAFWRNLRDGVESIVRFSQDELEDSFGPAVRNDPDFVPARATLDGIEDFDAAFFGMHGREAELTDPQHRVFLECAWQALEDAGYDPAAYAGAIGVFAGCSINTYFLHHVCQDRAAVDRFVSDYQVGSYAELVGSLPDFLATRVSYKLDLRGPSVTVLSACSTSLVAVAQACQSLMLYQSDMALAGGVSISVPQRRGYLAQDGAMVSTTGRVRTFDAGADGTVFGSGAGAVLLKRVEDALADGDHIYAVIRGSALNNDGASKAGFTAPSANGQAEAIAAALAAADVDARTIGYVECHGTATPLGDPIEVAGLTRAFRASTDDMGFCALGSVKPNVGHLDVAAGVTGLIKTALALKEAKLPPTLFFETPNPHIQFEGGPFYVNKEWRDWPRAAWPRRAGVSAFGLGGTNAHVVLEEAPAVASESSPPSSQLIVVSARSEAALEEARQNLGRHLEANPDLPLADVAYTQQVGRRAFAHRAAIVCQDARAAAEALISGSGLISGRPGPAAPPIAFMFPGQGAQYPGMGSDLFEAEPVFRSSMRRSAEILRPLLGRDLCALLYGDAGERLDAEALQATEIAQPALFALGYALAALWRSWGVEPEMLIGHSVGEFVAACLAGVFSLEDALALIAARGRLMQGMPPGSMLAVRLPESELAPLLTESLALAAVNGPMLCVAAGPEEAVAELDASLTARGVMARRLHTSHAFHTPMMDGAVAALEEQFSKVRFFPPKLRIISGVTGAWLTDSEAVSPAYWAGHCRAPVRFGDGLATLLRDVAADGRAPILLETGPGATLSTLARQAGAGKGVATVVASLPDASRPADDGEAIAGALAQLWCAGASIDWQGLHRDVRRLRVSLPTYPFERSRHWIEPPPIMEDAGGPPTQADPIRLSSFESNSPIKSTDIEIPTDMASAPAVKDLAAAQGSTACGARLRDQVTAVLEALSGDSLAGFSPESSFLEMGFDSLFLTQLTQELQREFKVKLTFRQLLGELSTIPALAEFLATKLPPEPPEPAQAPSALTPAVVQVAPRSSFFSASSEAPGVAAGAPDGAVAQIIREQLDVMSRLMAQQLEALRGAAPTPMEGAQLSAPIPPALSAPVASAQKPPEPEQGKSRFEMLAEARNAPASPFTETQKRALDDLTARINARTPSSKRLTAQHRPVLADPRAAAGFRQEWKDLVYPIVGERASGSRIWDIDGNAYIDLVNGYGQTAFGHAPPFVVEAIEAQLKKGFAIGPQAELAGEVAALFRELTGNERATFCNTGSEAVMAAMRVARTVTGRSKIATFNGDYHGQFDEVLVKGSLRDGVVRSMAATAGIPSESVENMIVLPYGAPASLEWIRAHADELAAVLVEPVQSRHPDLQPVDFLKELRAITQDSGAALIFDEVVTGFRMHPGGMQALFDIRADLATYGKVIGGGMPIGVLAGKAEFMDALDGGAWDYGDDSYPQVGMTFFAGTFVRHPLVLAAAWAVLNHLKDEGPALQERLTARTAALVGRLNGFLQRRGVDLHIETCGSLFYFNIAGLGRLASLFYPLMLERGVYIQEHYPCFLTTAHSEADITSIAETFESSIIAAQEAGFIPGPPGGPAHSERDSVGPAVSAFAAGASAENAVLEAPLTEAQTEIWLAIELSEEASCAFNESVTLRFRGKLHCVALTRALNQVVARHEALRGSFHPNGEFMRIAPSLEVTIAERSLEGLPDEAAEAAWRDLLKQDAETPFDLISGPLIRAQLVRRAPDDHALVLTAHHIVCDGWSVNVIIEELAKLYEAARSGAPADLPAPASFVAYGAHERALQAKDGAEIDSFWVPQFTPPPPPLDLPTDRSRGPVRTFRGATYSGTISVEATQQFRKAAARKGCTLFVALLAAFEALLARLSGQDEVVVGVSAAGQTQVEGGPLVGDCVNFLPLRARIEATTTLAEHLTATRQMVLAAYERQAFTLGRLMRKLAMPREHGQRPLVEAAFNLEQLGDGVRLPDLEIAAEQNPKRFANFDVFFNFIEQGGALRIDCDYNTDLYDAATIERWIGHYEILLNSIAREIAERDDARIVATLPLLGEQERAWLIAGLNDASAPDLDLRPAPELVAAQAQKTPDAIAVICEGAQLTYGELDRRANRLAHHLRTLVPAPGARIALAAERSLDMVVALLAILKAGYAYVPLDPQHPPARLRLVLDNAAAAALICDSAESAALVSDRPVIRLDADAAAIAACPASAPVSAADMDSACYVIFTSGSTGTPKGVEVSHRSLVNLLWSVARRPGFDARDVMVAVTTIAFDIAGLELFLPLIAGGRVVIAGRDDVRGGFGLVALIEKFQATMVQATPSLWRILIEAGFRSKPGLKMLSGGEALPRDLADLLLDQGGELWNLYGPTEATIWASVGRVRPSPAPITIGEPVLNTELHILDRNDQLAPVGVAGELFIGGAGLARGYFQRPDLDAEAFRNIALADGAPRRLYRTGDLARRLPDGAIEFLGRRDRQIKINGMRVELDEIESVLREDRRVADAVVTRETGGAKRIVAYVKLADAQTERDGEAAIANLRAKLPVHMVPSALIALDAFPLTANGKVDRSKLPELRESAVPPPAARAVAPEEAKLSEIWRSVLNVKEVGPDSNFFQLGGHSLLAVRLMSRVASAFGVKIRIGELFQAPTLREFAALISSLEPPPNISSVVQIQPKGSKTPVIAIHNSLMYYALAQKIGADRPFLGIKLFEPGSNAAPPEGTMSEIAADYVRLIRAARPHGPYILIGLCVAGVIAYEAAQQLRQAGESVPLVIMADALEPAYERRLSFGARLLYRIMDHLYVARYRIGLVRSRKETLATVLSFYTVVRKSRILDLAAWLGLIDPSERGKDDRETWTFLHALMKIQDRFEPSPYSGDVVLLKSDEIHDGFIEPQMGWADLIKGRIVAHRIPGWHEDMFRSEEGAALIAQHLRPLLEAADAGRGRPAAVAGVKTSDGFESSVALRSPSLRRA